MKALPKVQALLFFLLPVGFFFFFLPLWQVFTFPGSLRLFAHEERFLPHLSFPMRLYLQVDARRPTPVVIPRHPVTPVPRPSSTPLWVGLANGSRLASFIPGQTRLQIRFLGLVPLRTIRVEVLPPIKVIPGGQAVGVLVSDRGVLVVNILPVVDTSGRRLFPAKEAGIAVGDLILRIDDQEITEIGQVSALVAKAGRAGRALELVLLRNGALLHKTIRPVKSGVHTETGKYLLGLEIEDPAAGVGTLTFYDPLTRRYGALGHMIANFQAHTLTIKSGQIVVASIAAIEKGGRGRPGEKIGIFQNSAADTIGTIEKNTPYGIYGRLHHFPAANPYYPRPIPLALAHQIQPGPAEILTVLDGQRVERFRIRIEKVTQQASPAGKGLVIRVTDPALLNRTGGIIQGMSGSPIIQKGRLVGAVTHVFINNPVLGYGVLAEWMIKEAGLDVASPASLDRTA